MALSRDRSQRKVSGGRYKKVGKKLKQLLGLPALTKVVENTIKPKTTHGGGEKLTLLSTNIINVLDTKTKKFQKTEISTVLENPANRNYVRRNIITKGTIVETKLGKVKVTSRPGQEGTMNGILLK